MSSRSDLSQYRPRLRPGLAVIEDPSATIIEDARLATRVYLPPRLADVARGWTDGTQTFSECLARAAESSARKHPVRLRAMLGALKRLEDAGFLVEPLPAGLAAARMESLASPFSGRLPLLYKPLATLLRLPSLRLPIANRYAFRIFALLTLALGVWGVVSFLSLPQTLFLNAGEGGYAWAPLRILGALSVLVTALGGWTFVAQALLFGRIDRVELALMPVGIALRTGENLPSRRLDHVLYLVAKAAAYLAVWKLATLIIGLPLGPEHDLGLIALFLTFSLWSPYRQSVATELIERYADPEIVRHLHPYLRSRALFAFAGRVPIGSESFLLLYSCFAIGWSVAFIDAVSERVSLDWPSLAAAMTSGHTVQAFNAGCVLALLATLAAAGLAPLARIAANNVLRPFLGTIEGLARNLALRLFGRPALEPARLVPRLTSAPLFAGFPESALVALVARSRYLELPAGVPLLVQGADATEMYVLLEGEIEIGRREATGLRTTLARMQGPLVFGEGALEVGAHRQADVRTSSKVELLHIDGPVARADWYETLAPDLKARLRSRILLQQYLGAAKGFVGLPAEIAPTLERLGRVRNVFRGEQLINEHEMAAAFYLLLRGSADVTRGGRKLETLGQGSFIGEIALLTGAARTASVEMAEDGLVFELGKDAFWELVSRYPLLGVEIESLAERRLAATPVAPVERTGT